MTPGLALPVVVGLDLSLTGTGLATNTGLVGCIGNKGKKDATYSEREMRIRGLAGQIVKWVDALETTPVLCVIEGPSYGSVSGHQWDRAGLWWRVVGALYDAACPVVVVAPSTRAMYATGKGNAGKAQIVEAVTRRWGTVWPDLGSDDVADACVLAAMGSQAIGEPLAPMPQTHSRAIASVVWPWVVHGEVVA